MKFGELLTKHLEKMTKDIAFYNNYPQLLRSMSRLQLVDLSFFNDQAKAILNSLNELN